jgi:hypothetical protein
MVPTIEENERDHLMAVLKKEMASTRTCGGAIVSFFQVLKNMLILPKN